MVVVICFVPFLILMFSGECLATPSCMENDFLFHRIRENIVWKAKGSCGKTCLGILTHTVSLDQRKCSNHPPPPPAHTHTHTRSIGDSGVHFPPPKTPPPSLIEWNPSSTKRGTINLKFCTLKDLFRMLVHRVGFWS